MAESNALLGFGCTYEIKDGDGVYQFIGEVQSITPPNSQTDDVDVTHMQSPDRTREYIAGLIELGDCSFAINWIPGDDTDIFLQGLRVSGAKRDHRVTWPNGVTWVFNGYLKGFAPDSPMDGKMSAEITLKVAGSVSIGAAEAPTNTFLPSISGIAQVGQTLTALEGRWTGAPTFTYQWQRLDGTWGNVGGATARTYIPVVGQITQPLRVIVTGTNAEGNASATSGATAAVIAA